MTTPCAPEPTYSIRLVRPFLAVLRNRSGIPRPILRAFENLDPDARIPVRRALKLLERASEMAGDPELGLRAAHEATRGDYDLLEYAAISCQTGADVLKVIRRYFRLVNDLAELGLETHGERAIVRITSPIRLPRVAADFQSAAIYGAVARWNRPRPECRVEVWFRHPEPPDTREYARAFSPAVVRFSAPFDGFVFDRRWLDRQVPTADPKLHQLLCRHADERLAALPRSGSLLRRVRELVADELGRGNPSADHIAARLHMSRRTLTRRLEQMGTTFKALLDEVRRDLAMRWLVTEDVRIAELAHRLGFSEPAAFHRAFKRWSGKTPAQYRRDHWRGEGYVLE